MRCASQRLDVSTSNRRRDLDDQIGRRVAARRCVGLEEKDLRHGITWSGHALAVVDHAEDSSQSDRRRIGGA